MQKNAILIASLPGYTALTDVHGQVAAAYMVEEYVQLINESLVGKSYQLESGGDQLIIASPNADDIAKTLMRLYRNVAKEKYFLPMQAGMHYGEVLVQGKQFFGATMSLAARIATRADGIILASRNFMNALSCPNCFHYIHHDKLQFKDAANTIEIVELLPEYHQPATPGYAIPTNAPPSLGERQSSRYTLAGKLHFFHYRTYRNIFRKKPGPRQTIQPGCGNPSHASGVSCQPDI